MCGSYPRDLWQYSRHPRTITQRVPPCSETSLNTQSPTDLVHLDGQESRARLHAAVCESVQNHRAASAIRRFAHRATREFTTLSNQ